MCGSRHLQNSCVKRSAFFFILVIFGRIKYDRRTRISFATFVMCRIIRANTAVSLPLVVFGISTVIQRRGHYGRPVPSHPFTALCRRRTRSVRWLALAEPYVGVVVSLASFVQAGHQRIETAGNNKTGGTSRRESGATIDCV